MDDAGSPSRRSRIPLFDLLRGIGIVLVVFGHVTHDMPVRHFIYGFHMPLFFFLSGALFRERELASFGAFVKKKARGLLVPYVVFGLISLIWYLAVEIRVRPIDADTPHLLLGLVYGAYTKWIWFNGALWFLPCLFSAECLLWCVLKVSRNSRWIPWVLAAVGYAIGEAAVFRVPFPLPFGMEKACRFLVFLVLGHSLRPVLTHEPGRRCGLAAWAGVAVLSGFLLAVLPASWFGQTIGQSLFYDFVAYVPVAVLGIALCCGACRLVPGIPTLEFLGRNSLVFFAFQEQTYRLWIGVVSKAGHLPVETIRTSVGWTTLVTALTFAALLPAVWVWNRVTSRSGPPLPRNGNRLTGETLRVGSGST